MVVIVSGTDEFYEKKETETEDLGARRE